MLFFKRMGAKRLAIRALRVVYADNHCFRLWYSKGVYEYLRPVEKDGLKIETTPNVFFDGATLPSVIVHYKTDLVLATSVRPLGGNLLGDYQIIVYKKGNWINILNNLYNEAKKSREAYRH